MKSLSKQVDRAEVSIPLRSLTQIAAAIALAFPTAFAGHALGFGMATIAEEVVKSIPLAWFLYSMGEGIAASLCLAIFLSRFHASLAARLWSWLTSFVLLVLALPSMSVLCLQYFHSESVHFALICILFVMASLLWLAWLPWWHPSWLIRDQANR